MRCRSCCLSCNSALCSDVSGGCPGLMSAPTAGTGASGTEVEGGPDGETGADGVGAWPRPAIQSARTDGPSRKDQRDTLTLVLAAGVVPSLGFSQGSFTLPHLRGGYFSDGLGLPGSSLPRTRQLSEP